MLSNKVAVALLGLLALVGAAGAVAFFASRQSTTPVAAYDVAAPAAAVPANGKAVEATEAVLEDKPAQAETAQPPANEATAAPASSPSAASAPTPRKRQESAPIASRTRPVARPASRNATPSEPDSRAARVPETHPAQVPESRSTRPSAPDVTSPNRGSVDQTTTRADHVEPVEPLSPPTAVPQFTEVTVPADSVIGLRIETALSSETAHVEERVEARVTRDVRADGRVAIPSGSRVLGSVSVVDRGGRMKEQARLGVRFHTVILADGTELPLQTDTVYRVGDSPTSASAAKVGGGAIGGAILGAILGGGKGAAIGGAVGAAGGTAAVMAGGRRAAQIAPGSPVTVKVLSPVTVTVEKE
jgi:hypothetical protein